ncbi:MAG: hypothetical protein J6Q76_05015 [Clostridia bacterium]|nr:hypothetical protein [Clostridia bacterium]
MDEKQIEKMISMAAKKLGMTPDQLKESAMSGNVDTILAKMDSSSADKVRSVMSDKKLVDDLTNKFKNK